MDSVRDSDVGLTPVQAIKLLKMIDENIENDYKRA